MRALSLFCGGGVAAEGLLAAGVDTGVGIDQDRAHWALGCAC